MPMRTPTQRLRRVIRVYGRSFAHGHGVPLFVGRALNLAVDAEGNDLVAARTRRRYRRRDNKAACEDDMGLGV